MQAKHITTGMTVRIDIRGRLTAGTVISQTGEGRSIVYCVRLDSGTERALPASKLWPMPESILGGWETTGGQIVAPTSITGTRINRRRMIETMGGINARRIKDACGQIHVGASRLEAVRSVYAAAGKRSLRDAPPAFRRGAVHMILATHAANVAEYRAVMGHAPLPTEAQITAAMLACR